MSGQMRLDRQTLTRGAHDAVLAALDEWAKASGLPLPKGQEGAMDKDLPELFRGIDAHVEKLIERAGVLVFDKPE